MTLAEPGREGQPDVSRITAEPLLYREITISVRGKATPTICPIWCALDHDGERVTDLADVSHWSPMLPLGQPASDPDRPPVSEAGLYWTPDGEQGKPLLLVWGDGEAAELDLPAAEELLAKLTRLVGQLRALKAASALAG